MTETLHRDIYPAETFAPDVSEHPTHTRVFVTSSRVQVWRETADGGPELMLDEAITGEVPQRDRSTQFGELRIETARGPVYVTQGRGCGCGSPLKALDAPGAW